MRRGRLVAAILLVAVLAAGIARYENSGSVERLVELPGYPEHLALDEQTGRLFVALAPTGMGSLTESVGVLDSSNGTLLRTLQTPLRVVGAHCCDLEVFADELTDRVFVSSSGDPRLLVLDAQNGDLRAVVPDASPLANGLLLSKDQRRVLIVESSMRFRGVLVLDGSSGAVLRSIPCPGAGDVFAAQGLALGTGGAEYHTPERVFIGAPFYRSGPGVCVIDPAPGRKLLRVRLSTGNHQLIDALALDQQTSRVFVSSHRDRGSDPQVGAGSVTTLDARTGHVIGSTRVGFFPFRMVVSAGAGHIFVLNTGDFGGPASISMLDATTGRLLRTMSTGPVPVSLAIEARTGELVVNYQNGNADRLDPRDGQVLSRTVAKGMQPILLGQDARAGRAYTLVYHGDWRMTAASSSIQVRDIHTGRILRAIAVSGAVGPMAIDTRRHRAFVAVAGCTEPAHDRLGWLPDWLRGRLPWLSAPPAVSDGNGCVLVLDAAR